MSDSTRRIEAATRSRSPARRVAGAAPAFAVIAVVFVVPTPVLGAILGLTWRRHGAAPEGGCTT
jgi:hypothetical protein